MKNFIHMLAHWLDLNRVITVSEYDEDGYLWTAFKCETCGKISYRKRFNFRFK